MRMALLVATGLAVASLGGSDLGAQAPRRDAVITLRRDSTRRPDRWGATLLDSTTQRPVPQSDTQSRRRRKPSMLWGLAGMIVADTWYLSTMKEDQKLGAPVALFFVGMVGAMAGMLVGLLFTPQS